MPKKIGLEAWILIEDVSPEVFKLWSRDLVTMAGWVESKRGELLRGRDIGTGAQGRVLQI